MTNIDQLHHVQESLMAENREKGTTTENTLAINCINNAIIALENKAKKQTLNMQVADAKKLRIANRLEGYKNMLADYQSMKGNPDYIKTQETTLKALKKQKPKTDNETELKAWTDSITSLETQLADLKGPKGTPEQIAQLEANITATETELAAL